MSAIEKQYETIQLDRIDTTLVIKLHRPDKFNALNFQLRTEVVDALAAVNHDDSIRAIIIWGGPDAFAAGADLNEFKGRRPMEMFRPLSPVPNLWQAVAKQRQPTIAAVAGPALAGGCELAMACDFRIADETAVFAQTEINVGIIPGAGGTQRIVRLIGIAKAKEMAIMGGRIDAEEAYRIGLVNKVVPPGELFAEAKKWADRIATKSAIGVSLAKILVDSAHDVPLDIGLMMESLGFAGTFSTEDKEEGVSAFLEKRKPAFKGR